jgi:hypothetical protein
MFIEFETGSGRTLLNVRHIVQVKRFQDLSELLPKSSLPTAGSLPSRARTRTSIGRLKWSPERSSQPRGPRGPRQGLLPEAAAFDTTHV